ncbi:cobalt ECF transporter T component CbiQ [Mesoterricola sediminis]|uniref:Cobalt ECF transporter T component CbiQ n=1 Tax=Mesoterricola sediminis TaxID=2927980 RepID=A0AA48HF32_9BACT|nr:cobalt ECF transporter T component CbiQ [Mesoterricola sediminis]BDU77073.1 cobalt ECF transporter T component CbiQ [Mesoterricola sediminis]
MGFRAAALHHFATLDELAHGDSPIHRLDPRAKVAATALFILAVASFPRYAVAALAPYALFPAALAALGGVPAAFLGRRLLAALPFVLCLAAFNPLLDRVPVADLGGAALTGGWASFASILLRFALTVSAAVALAATTGVDGVTRALERLGAPAAFTRQLAFLHRYAFVLGEEAFRLNRARALRAFGRRTSPAEFASLAGHALLRAWDRARRVHVAMLSRGFTGRFPDRRPLAWRPADTAFLAAWAAFFACARVWDLASAAGALILGGRP